MRSLSTVEKAIDVLFLLSEYPAGLGVTEIGRKLSLKTSSAHQFLASLRKKAVIEQDPFSRAYRIGPRILRLCRSYYKQIDLTTRVLPFLQSLRDRCGETVVLNMLSANRIIRVAQVEGVHAIRRIVEIGDHQPLHLGSTGKAVIAFLPDEELEEVIRGAKEAPDFSLYQTQKGPLFDRKWRQQLLRVRRQGYAISMGEMYKGVRAVSAPVFNSSNRVIGCVTITGPADRFKHAVIKTQVKPLLQTADSISLALGSTMTLNVSKTTEGEIPIEV